jgi:hypothetical protein
MRTPVSSPQPRTLPMSTGRAALLSHLYGFLAPRGRARAKRRALTWGDLDLERGAITLDHNKPTIRELGPSMRGWCRALKAWRELGSGRARRSPHWERSRLCRGARRANQCRPPGRAVSRPFKSGRHSTTHALRQQRLPSPNTSARSRATFITIALAIADRSAGCGPHRAPLERNDCEVLPRRPHGCGTRPRGPLAPRRGPSDLERAGKPPAKGGMAGGDIRVPGKTQ